MKANILYRRLEHTFTGRALGKALIVTAVITVAFFVVLVVFLPKD